MPRAFHRGMAPGGVGLLALALLVSSEARGQQLQLGQKTLGTLGVRAASQLDGGLYVADRLLWYSAHQLRDRNGERLATAVNLDAVGNAVGVVAVFSLPWSTYLNLSLGVPVAAIRANTEQPEASTDRFGLGDLYLQPARLGLRLPHWDLTVGYALYVPSGFFEPLGGEGVGRGHWTHEFSAGATAYFDLEKRWSLSALASYEHNLRKRGVDITRGDTIQIQGGWGKLFLGCLEPGLTGYVLWQVTENQGSELPGAFLGSRDYAIGLGAQLSVLIPAIRGKVTLSYSRDLEVRARPLGQLLLLGVSITAWKP